MANPTYTWADDSSLLNDQVKAKIGEEALATADLSSITDFGKVISNMDGDVLLPIFNGILVKMTKTIVKDLNLTVEFPYLYRTSDEWGGIQEAIKVISPEAQSPTNHNLVDNREYVDGVYRAPHIKCTIWDGPEASFEFAYSIDLKDWMKAFASEAAYSAFMTARHNAIRRGIVLRKNMIARDALCAMAGETVYDEFSTGEYAASTGVRAINLAYLFNANLAAADQKDNTFDWSHDESFQRFIRSEISRMPARLKGDSVLYNMAGDLAQTNAESPLHTILLNDFVHDNRAYFLTDAFRDVIDLPEHETVDYWQGQGTAADFATKSKIDVVVQGTHSVELSNVIGMMFSEKAVNIHNEAENVRSKYIASGDFYNYWETVDGKIILMPDENFVVYFVQFPAAGN